MNYQEIVSTLQFTEAEAKVFMPNEIFEDLQNNMKKGVHIPVAYAYYYLTSYLYRQTKYDTVSIDNKMIKQILGYHADTKGIDYIIKKNGVLDIMGYTETVKDYPVFWEFEEEGLKFTLLSEVDETTQVDLKKNKSRKYTIKYPVKAFNRYIDDEEMKEEYIKGYEDGTFFEFDNTHLIPFEIFLYCMSNDKIGCTGFYLYSFIKMKNQHFHGKYDCSMEGLAENTGLPTSTMKESLSLLRKYKVVEGIHNQEFFCMAYEEHMRKANSYIANEIENFTDAPVEFEKMKVLKVNEYYQILEDKRKEEDGDREPFPLELLPY